MHVRHALKFTGFTITLVAVALTGSSRVLAGGPGQAPSHHHHMEAAKDNPDALVAIVRAATSFASRPPTSRS